MEYIISSWKQANKLNIYRGSPCGLYRLAKIDKGVNYFVLALEKIGCQTFYSCEGHFNKDKYIPQLYITFKTKKHKKRFLQKLLFNVAYLEQDTKNQYSIRIDFLNHKDKIKKLTFLSEQWNKILGPILYQESKYETI